MSWFIFTRDISANLSLFSKKKKKTFTTQTKRSFLSPKVRAYPELNTKNRKAVFIYLYF